MARDGGAVSSICNPALINWEPAITENATPMSATILVVEDEPSIQELIAASLQHAGHLVLRADSAEQALQLVNETLPDVVLLDWMLPGLSGIQCARRLRSAERTSGRNVVGRGFSSRCSPSTIDRSPLSTGLKPATGKETSSSATTTSRRSGPSLNARRGCCG